ncbi:hypothetical protein CDAR_388271 [Caerostris darwini]|uniref:Uncharacterized protein n=1 Tax=Caerostris darwini TaxID=1538125 RepID=A0AAV4WC27_9ARAC|nr:hypothetical protein CDAR_388271 [Caerostris darwini]
MNKSTTTCHGGRGAWGVDEIIREKQGRVVISGDALRLRDLCSPTPSPLTEGDCSRKRDGGGDVCSQEGASSKPPLIKTTPLGLRASIIGGGVRKNGMIEMWQHI